MGAEIGLIPGFLASNPSSQAVRPALFGQEDDPRDLGPFFRRERREPPRVGFGEGTVSTPGAAIEALGRGLRAARQIVPSAEETRNDLRQSLESRRAALAERAQARPEDEGGVAGNIPFTERRIVRRVPEPSAQARHFVNRLNETAGAVQARLGGEATEAPTGPSFEVGGQTFSVRLGGEPSFSTNGPGPRFDVRA